MPRLSSSQQLARRHILEAAGSGFAPEPLGGRIMRALTAAIPVDGFRLFGVDPETLLVNRLLAASDSDGWARAEWLREVYLRSGEFGYIELPALMRAGLMAVASHETQETCWGYSREMLRRLDPAAHYRLFHELRSPVGGTLLACFPAGGQWVAALQAYRRDSARPFRASDVAFTRQLAPAIGQAIAAALRVERARAEPAGEEDASGIVMLGPDGAVRFATPAGEAWLSRLAEPGGRERDPIPTAAWSAVARLRAELAPAAAVVAPSRRGPVRIEASPAGADGGVALVLTPERRGGPAGAPAWWPLTQGERRVIDLALRGLTNAQIGERLFISVNTVEWHLRAVYEKLGVRNRSGLLVRLFSETAAPGLLDAGPALGASAD